MQHQPLVKAKARLLHVHPDIATKPSTKELVLEARAVHSITHRKVKANQSTVKAKLTKAKEEEEAVAKEEDAAKEKAEVKAKTKARKEKEKERKEKGKANIGTTKDGPIKAEKAKMAKERKMVKENGARKMVKAKMAGINQKMAKAKIACKC